MRIAVTGATGFIGRHVVEHFATSGHEVLALGRSINNLNIHFDDTITKFETDYNERSLCQILKNAEVVVHLAAERMRKLSDPLDLHSFFKTNVELTGNLLRSAFSRNIKTVCNISTISVYSPANQLPFTENEMPKPTSVYGLSKLMAEQYAGFISAKTGLNVVNLRFAQVFGTGERPDMVFMKYFDLARKRMPLIIWGEGKNSMDHIYVKDAVSAISAAIEHEEVTGTFNIGSGMAVSVSEIAARINRVTGNVDNIQFDRSKKEEGYEMFFDCSKAMELLHWQAAWRMEDAIADMLVASVS